MAGSIVRTGQTLVAGIRGDFWNMYQPTYDGVLSQLGSVCLLDVPSDKRTEIYGARKTMAYPELWPLGDPIPTEGTDSIQFPVTNYRYAKRIQWNRDDRMDNLVGDLFGEARTLGAHFASLPSRLFADVITDTPNVLPAIPPAADGAALYSTTDGGGGDRFGIADGNLITGTGVATAEQVISDFYAAISQMGGFLNTKGEPFFEPDVNTQSYLVYAPIGLAEVFSQAFTGQAIHSVVNTSGAAVSNVILTTGVPVEFRFTTRLTGNSWLLFRKDAPVKAVFMQRREALRESAGTEENSDQARDTGVEYVQYVERLGVGVNVPYATLKVSVA